MEYLMGTHNEAGVLIPPFDMNAYEGKLRRLMSDETECKRLSERAVIKAKQYDMSTAAEQWVNLFKELTS